MTRSNSRLILAVQIASLCTTGLLLWLGSSAFRLARAPLSVIVEQAFLFAFVAWLWSAATAFLLYLAIPRPPGEYMLLRTLRTSAVAVWFAPATILLSRMSPATLLAALALVVTATRLLYSEWRLIHPVQETAFAGPHGLFDEYLAPDPLFRREFLTALTVSMALQSAATARMFHHPVTAGALFTMTVAALTLFAMTSGVLPAERPRNLPQTLLGILLTIFLAAGVTIGGLGARLLRGNGSEGDSADGPPAATASNGKVASYQPRAAVGPGDGSFPGVVLRPDTKPFARLVEPPPVRGAVGISLPRTYAIPFDGEYWMYRFLYRRPPPKSLEERGSPTELSFSTVDSWPLEMEAHQKFDQPLDLACRAVRVDIWNADRYPNTIVLELDALGSHGWETIGAQPVRSLPVLTSDHLLTADRVAPVAESLEFPVHSPIHECLELKVVFLRARVRIHRSAMVSIDRFVLLP